MARTLINVPPKAKRGDIVEIKTLISHEMETRVRTIAPVGNRHVAQLRSRDRERKLIKKIEEATAKIDSNDYGYCETCGVEIGVQRLEARPTATLCIDCKTLDEIREKADGLKPELHAIP